MVVVVVVVVEVVVEVVVVMRVVVVIVVVVVAVVVAVVVVVVVVVAVVAVVAVAVVVVLVVRKTNDKVHSRISMPATTIYITLQAQPAPGDLKGVGLVLVWFRLRQALRAAGEQRSPWMLIFPLGLTLRQSKGKY